MDAEWKKKYLDCLDDQEHKEQNWIRTEETMRLAINRVSLAAEGVDSNLDSYLGELRKIMRAGTPYHGLEVIIEKISNVVKLLDEQRQNVADVQTPLQMLATLLDQLQFPKQCSAKTKALRKSIKNADERKPLDYLLRELASIVNEALTAEPKPGQEATVPAANDGGLLGRLFKSNSSAQDQMEPVDGDVPTHGNKAVSETDSALEQLNQQIFQQARINLLQSISTLNIAPASKSEFERQVNASNNVAEILACYHDIIARLSDTDLEMQAPSQLDFATDNSAHSPTPAPTSAELPEAVTFEGEGTGEHHQDRVGRQQAIVNHFCLSLLEALHFPDTLSEQVEALRETLTEDTEKVNSAAKINQLADLVTLSYLQLENEKRELQEFLQHLTKHLKDIDQQLTGAEDNRLAVEQSTKRLDTMVQAQVDDIENSVNVAIDLPQLKDLIQQRLLTIREHFTEHRLFELNNQQLLKQALAQSNARLRALEKESQQLRERLNQQHQRSIKDPLTGIYNRLAYEERIQQEYARWNRYRQPLVIMLVDIDYFKKINDTYGHKAGDNALRLIANVLNKNIRESDFLARYGGEEFVVLLPHTELEPAVKVADKLRKSVEKCQFHYQEKRVNITISCGVTEFRDSDTIETAFERADNALYQAKENGRNCCERAA